MASTYSSNLRLELMATGANAATWGTNTNDNLSTLDAFVNGFESISVAGSSNVSISLSSPEGQASDQAANKVIELNGALTGNIYVFLPETQSNYLIYNNTSGSYTVTMAVQTHEANGEAVISQSAWHWVYCEGSAGYAVKEAELGTNASTISSGTLSIDRIANGSLTNAKLDNSAITINGTGVSLGGSINVGDITGVTAGTNLTGGGTTGTVTLNMATGGIGSGTYGSTADGTKIDTITVDAYGRVTAVATGPTGTGDGDITGVTAGTGLTGGGSSGSVTLNVNTTAGGVGTYNVVGLKPTDQGGSNITWSKGGTVAGSNLWSVKNLGDAGGAASDGSTAGSAFSGTWRNMGGTNSTNTSSNNPQWRGFMGLRIS